MEHGYGYPTDTVSGDTISMWEGLINNDTDVTMEIWLPNQQNVWNDALETGVVVDVGKSLEDNWQGFVIPQYVKDAKPRAGVGLRHPRLHGSVRHSRLEGEGATGDLHTGMGVRACERRKDRDLWT